ncbi:MAG: YcxB family protein [Methanobacteriota archaeon]
MTDIILKFKYTEDEFVKTMKKLNYKFYKWQIFYYICFIIMGLINWLFWNETTLIVIWISLGIFGLFIFSYDFYIQPRRFFRKHPKLHDDFNITFTDEGIEIKTKQINLILGWNNYKKVLEDKSTYILVRSLRSKIITELFRTFIPKRVFENSQQEEDFRKLLSEKVSKDFNKI